MEFTFGLRKTLVISKTPLQDLRAPFTKTQEATVH